MPIRENNLKKKYNLESKSDTNKAPKKQKKHHKKRYIKHEPNKKRRRHQVKSEGIER
jgi:hypothetical protein